MEPKVGSRQRILTKLSDRLGQAAGSVVRRDIGIITYDELGEGQARVIASFMGDVPTFEEVRAWAIDLANGHIKVYPETLAHYETAPYPILSFVAELNEIRKPMKEVEKSEAFVAVGKTTFLDTDLGTTWEKKEVDGKSFLVRVQPDGLQQALEKVVSSAGPRMREIANQILAVAADAKDKVRYFRPDTTVGIGTVMSVSEDGMLTIKDSDTHNVYERTRGTVLEVLEAGPNTKTRRQLLEDYHSQYLGKDLAKQMTS